MKKNITRKQFILWETVCYVALALCIFGQITVGKFYLVAQCAYLVANITSVIRDYALGLPAGNKVKDFAFTGITLALIIIRLF